VDKSLGHKVWRDAYSHSLYQYFFFTVLIFQDSWEKKYDQPDGNNARLSIFKTEVERLAKFFGHFISGQDYENISNSADLIVGYLEARNEQELTKKLQGLVREKVIRSEEFLVGWMLPRPKLLT